MKTRKYEKFKFISIYQPKFSNSNNIKKDQLCLDDINSLLNISPNECGIKNSAASDRVLKEI